MEKDGLYETRDATKPKPWYLLSHGLDLVLDLDSVSKILSGIYSFEFYESSAIYLQFQI